MESVPTGKTEELPDSVEGTAFVMGVYDKASSGISNKGGGSRLSSESIFAAPLGSFFVSSKD
jgi:hypothetical protein